MNANERRWGQKSFVFYLRSSAFICGFIFLFLPNAAAQTPVTERNPSVPAVKVDEPPKIDGVLDDATWQRAVPVRDFFHELTPADESTTVYCCFDRSNLYFAFECSDSNPSAVRGQQKKRNGSMDDEDWVAAGVDALADRRSMYWFTVNPLGTMSEEIPGGAAAKVEWRGDWHAAARRTAKGWTAEMAIPFELLRYPPGQRKFGLIFRRHVSRTSREYCWPIRCNYHTRDNQASWDNLETPRVERRPRIMPYLIVGAGGDLRNEAGVDVKYQAENNVTGLFSFRPDFQTIEDVIDTVDFSYNPRQLDDRRPFFMEGSDHFGDSSIFYSRNIGQVDAGLKGFGKIGRVSFGAMDATRVGRQNDAMLTLGYDPSRYTGVGFSAVDHRASGIANTVLKLNGSWWKPMRTNSLWVYGSIYQSVTSGQPGGEGTMVTAGVDRWNGWGELGWHLNFRHVPEEFETSLGYLPEKGVQGVNGWLDYGREVKKGPLLNWGTSLNYDYTNNIDGGLFNRTLEPGFNLNFRNAMRFGANYTFTDRPPHTDRIASLNFGWNVRDLYQNGNVQLRYGRQASGDYRFFRIGQGIQLSDPLSLRLGVEVLRLDYDDPAQKDENVDQLILTGVYDLTAERGIALRVHQHTNGFNFYAAYRQELRRGADMFIIFGDPNANEVTMRLAVKMVNTY
jgi:hypothetical protein